MSNLTFITLAWELYEQGVNIGDIAHQLGKHRETIGLWVKRIKEVGLSLSSTQFFEQVFSLNSDLI